MCHELSGVIVGMTDVTEQLMIGILCRGHCILQGMPGLAKTLLISQLAALMDLTFHRIQFTPDLMPADITGSDVLEEDRTTGQAGVSLPAGAAVRQLILADEINRTPPKTQARCWRRCRSGSSPSAAHTYPLPEPFFVLATQNPIEAGRHLSAARGAARPLHDEDQGRVPEPRTTNGKSVAGKRPTISSRHRARDRRRDAAHDADRSCRR